MQSFHRPLGTFRCFRHTPGHSVFVHAARLWLAEASGSWLGSVATHFEGTALSRAKKWGNSIGFYIVQMDNNNMAYTRTTYLWWFRGWSNYYCFPTLYRYMRVRVSIFHIYMDGTPPKIYHFWPTFLKSCGLGWYCPQSLQILAALQHPLPTLKKVGFGRASIYIYY